MAKLLLFIFFTWAFSLQSSLAQRYYQRPNGRNLQSLLLGNRYGGGRGFGYISPGRVTSRPGPAMAAPQISFDEDQADNSGTAAPGDGAADAAAGGAGQAAEATAANAAANVQSGAGNRNSANANQFNANMPQGPPPTDLPSMARQLNGLSGGTCLAVCESIYARASQFRPNSSAITRMIFGCPQLCGIFDNIAQIGIMGLSAFLAG